MKNAHTFATLAASALAATPVFAGYPGDYPSDYDVAEVLSAEPLLRQVRVAVPQRECHAETRYVPVSGSRGGTTTTAGSMLIGGLIGAVIGHQIDDRRSRNSGTIAGALIGTAIGHEAAQGDARVGFGEYRAIDAERCEVHTVERVEERIEGYRVTYRYNGRTYATQMPRDPGATLRVRVNVAPLG